MTENTDKKIDKDLKEQGNPVTKVVRMKGKKRYQAPLVRVELSSREDRTIDTDLRFCCELSVQVESVRLKSEMVQCYKCHLFGHVQRNCHSDPKCMRSGEAHNTYECTKARTSKPRCANCSSEHLSTNVHCIKNPNNPKNNKMTTRNLEHTPQPPANYWQKRAEEAERQQKQKTENLEKVEDKSTAEDELAMILGKMLIEFCSNTNTTRKQKLDLIDKQDKLIELFRQNSHEHQ
ncbi:hypothetical protein WA026_000492 [Henosepilachna vigintioctopunctata]|uniref:CCHC-type domain-containing protein n=1 Tax=Henosepilachna vigintioctopunctata TaxID=420089 RepID=A0AAW1V407_9CUCU